MKEKKTGIAIIGYGGMGGWHCDTIKRIDCLELCGIYDIAEDRRKVAKENGIYAYESMEELLADENVSLVTVAIPIPF